MKMVGTENLDTIIVIQYLDSIMVWHTNRCQNFQRGHKHACTEAVQFVINRDIIVVLDDKT